MKFCYNESKNNDNLKIPGRKAFFMLTVAAFMAGKDNAVEQQIAQGIYYLKKCIMVLRGAEQLPSLAPLCERLIKEGINCQVMLSEELSPDVLQAGEMLAPGLLYLTDDPLIYAMLAAEEERSQGNALPCCPPALVYLHPGNRDEDFGDARYALEEPEETEPEYLERVYRRCHNLPWEILVTDRCWLRETVEEDVDSFWKMYQDSELSRYTERLYPTPEAERGYVREYRRLVYSFYEFGVWTVLDRQSGAVVGRAGLSVREGYDLPELGFVIGREEDLPGKCARAFWNMPGSCWALSGCRCWCMRRIPCPCTCAKSSVFGSRRRPRRQGNPRETSRTKTELLVRVIRKRKSRVKALAGGCRKK